MHTRFMTGPLVGLCLFAGVAHADVFINEFHYDNSGTDVGERIEVVAPAGTSLNGWTVVLYNGGGGARYATLNLSGTAANQCNGYGTLVVDAAGMQNGSPDGLALVNASGQVVQFLSYEGSFTATDGPASGLQSVDIGQAETTGTAVGHSLQLAGSGSSAADFSWQAPSAASFGSCNAGQSFTGGTTPPPPSSNELVNGVAKTGLGASSGTSLEYQITLPAGASNLSIATAGGSGDADLYVKFGSAPTTSSYDCRPYKNGNNETCSVAAPSAGVYYVMVRAYSTFSGLTLTGSFTEPSAPPPPPPPPPPPSGNTLSKGVPISGLSANSGSSLNYTMDVPAGASNLGFVTSGGTGDADLYVKFGSVPSTSSYDCRPYKSGNAESCDFASPQAGTWYVMVRAYSTFSGLTLSADYTAASGGGGDYYAGVITTSSSGLRSSLHAIIDDHTKFPYSASTTDTWDILELADQDPLDSSRVLDIYKNTSYAKAGGGNNFYNREHTWPKSYGFPDDAETNYPYTDMHMLMLSEINYNSARGNLPFGNCNASCTEYPTQSYAGQGGGSGTFPGNSNWSNGSIWQVWSKLKGDVARALFYMDVRYEGGTHGVTGAAEPDLILTDNMSLVSMTGGNVSVAYMGSLSVLLQWHAEDPPTEAERLRNALVESYQGNRNPFVDHPEWVGCVFQNVCQ